MQGTQAEPALRLDVAVEDWPIVEPLKVAGYTLTGVQVVVVTLTQHGFVGRGEASGIFYFGDTAQALRERIEAVRPQIEAGLDRAALRELLPPGGARNALDCALWDLEAKRTGQPVWQLAGLASPQPLPTTFTIGAATPERMAQVATQRYPAALALKLKLLGDGQDGARVQAVRAARPEVWLGVDGNQGFDVAGLNALLPRLVAARVELIEQPFPAIHDSWLDGFKSPIPLAADESAQCLADLPAVARRYAVVNIKLDKCGGLTEALLMAEQARHLGLRVMVGNMGGTSLATAPALLVGQCCDLVDLDGPVFLQVDRTPAVVYEAGRVHVPTTAWGGC